MPEGWIVLMESREDVNHILAMGSILIYSFQGDLIVLYSIL